MVHAPLSLHLLCVAAWLVPGAVGQCPAGQYSLSGSCANCEGAQYSSAGASSCSSCDAGSETNAQNSNCIACAAGQSSSSGTAGACSNCAAGQYASGTGNTGCDNCEGAEYSSAGASSCSSCSAGSETNAQNSNCIACPAGQSSSSGTANACNDCPAGQYSQSGQANSCPSCDSTGYVTDTLGNAGATTCTACPEGKYWTMSTTACIDCAVGQYVAGTANTGCSNCEPNGYDGYVTDTLGEAGATTCTPCPAGKYWTTSTTACIDCDAGQHTGDANAQPACWDCPATYYADQTGTANCAFCNPGSITMISGFNGGEGSTGCQACSAGQYSPQSTTDCQDCATGQHTDDLNAQTICSNCPPGEYADQTGTTNCALCNPGWITTIDGFHDGAGSTGCQECGTGQSSPSSDVNCADCNPGFYAGNTGMSACDDCPAGSITTVTPGCVLEQGVSPDPNCPLHSGYAATGCSACAAGQYSPESTVGCEFCAVWQYQGATGQSSCLDCPDGSITTIIEFHSGEGSTGCQECGAGQYSTVPTQDCIDCALGQLTGGSTGQSTCPPCIFTDTTAFDLHVAATGTTLAYFTLANAVGPYSPTYVSSVAISVPWVSIFDGSPGNPPSYGQPIIAGGESWTLGVALQGAATPGVGNYSTALTVISNAVNGSLIIPLELTVSIPALGLVTQPSALVATTVPLETRSFVISTWNAISLPVNWTLSSSCMCQYSNDTECRLMDAPWIEISTCGGTDFDPQQITNQAVEIGITFVSPNTTGDFFHFFSFDVPSIGASWSIEAQLTVQTSPLLFSTNLSFFLATWAELQQPNEPLTIALQPRDVYDNEIELSGPLGDDGVFSIELAVVTAANVSQGLDSPVLQYNYQTQRMERSVHLPCNGTFALALLHNLSATIQPEQAKLQGEWSSPMLIEVYAISCDSADTYASSDGTTCLVSWCNAGWEPNDAFTDCVECQPGHFSSGESTACSACEPGTFCSEIQCTTCTECPVGHVSSIEGAETCSACEPGQYAANITTACVDCERGTFCSEALCSTCTECPVGHVSSIEGAETCSVCEPGQYAANITTACVDCERGTFCSEAPCSTCTECPVGHVSSNEGTETCSACMPGQYAADPTTACVDCERGTFCSEAPCYTCEQCPDGQVSSNEGGATCLDCTDNTAPSTNRSECQCDEGFVNSTALVVLCYANDYKSGLTNTYVDACTKCPPCLDCSSSAAGIILRRGYRLFAPQTPANGTRRELHAFRCDLEGACPQQLLTTSNALALAEFHDDLQPQQCTDGHHGVLCALCEDGWSHSRQELCTECSTSSVWWVWGGAFVLMGAIGFYFVAQKFLATRRHREAKKKGSIAVLFAALDKDGSGEISLDEFQASLKTLNLSMSERAAAEVLASIDIDHSATIGYLEFEAWMQHSAGKMERIKTAIRIVIGLAQVLKDMPQIQKQQEKYPAEWEVLSYFTPSLELLAPCITFNYTGRFLTNSFVVPLLLMGCVAVAWFFSQRSSRPERGSREEKEAQLQRRSDFYFAFFVCYPSMSQCWFNHFNCRALSMTVSVLVADNAIQCYQDPLWWGLAAIAAVGIITVSFGVPVIYWIWMHRVMSRHLKAVSRNDKSLIVAYRDFAQQFSYIAGAYRPQAFMAESIDLLRKLILAGLVMFVQPGTVVQCFVSGLISLFFVLLHLRMWPYPHFGPNVLKLVTELQIFLVLFVSVVFHFDEQQLVQDGVGQTFYQRLMLALLAVTSFAFPAALFPMSSAERAHAAIVRMGTEGADKLEQRTTDQDVTSRIRIAVAKLTAVTALHQQALVLTPSVRAIFQQIDRDGSGRIAAGDLLAWWAAHEPTSVNTGGARSSSRVTTIQEHFDQVHIEHQTLLDFSSYENVLKHLIETEHISREGDRGRRYFVNVHTHKSIWTLPTVTTWLHDLHKSTPPGLLTQAVLNNEKFKVETATNPLSVDYASKQMPARVTQHRASDPTRQPSERAGPLRTSHRTTNSRPAMTQAQQSRHQRALSERRARSPHRISPQRTIHRTKNPRQTMTQAKKPRPQRALPERRATASSPHERHERNEQHSQGHLPSATAAESPRPQRALPERRATASSPHKRHERNEQRSQGHLPSATAAECWEERFSQTHKRTYYRNNHTGETSWIKPRSAD